MSKKVIGLVGARGYTGKELLGLILRHPELELGFASSRELAGTAISEYVEGWPEDGKVFEQVEPDELARRELDLCVLALPNGIGQRFVEAIDAAKNPMKIVDLSADGRFDEAWQYGWPERLREQISKASRIANPGCYATGMQTALWPLADQLAAPPVVFGISGYSGAGTKPSPKNDPENLRDNLLPYKLVEHTHEREVSRQLGTQIYFTPHVASFFRGITLTISVRLDAPTSAEALLERYREVYADEPLVRVVDEIPVVRDAMQRHVVTVGGVQVDETGQHAVILATLDNLLKGAATQAMQNINLLLGFAEHTSIPVEEVAAGSA